MRSHSEASQKETRGEPEGGRVILAAGIALAATWTIAFAAAAFGYWSDALFRMPPTTIGLILALDLAPALVMVFAAFAASESARTRRETARLAALAPAPAMDAAAVARALAAELSALDTIVQTTAGRLDKFERALAQDGGAMARALAEDVETLTRARAKLVEDSKAAHHSLKTQIDALTAVADRTTTSAVQIETAVAKATGLIERQRPTPAPANDRQPAGEEWVLAGRGQRANVLPQLQTVGALARAPATDSVPTLYDIVRAAGLQPAEPLPVAALDTIARAGAKGADARRAAVRQAAPQAVRKLETYFRRNTPARREAETLRRTPARALGEAGARQRETTCAYLLVDAALG